MSQKGCTSINCVHRKSQLMAKILLVVMIKCNPLINIYRLYKHEYIHSHIHIQCAHRNSHGLMCRCEMYLLDIWSDRKAHHIAIIFIFYLFKRSFGRFFVPSSFGRSFFRLTCLSRFKSEA